MDMETYFLYARAMKGKLISEDYVEWAISCLLKDIETPSILSLASSVKPYYKPEIEQYFYKSLKELGWDLPGFRESAMESIKFLASRILDGTFEPITTAHEIFKFVRDLEYPSDLVAWLQIDDYIDEKIYCGMGQISDEKLINMIHEEARKLLSL